MRFMMLMIPGGYEKAAPDARPDAKAVEAMMKYNESLQKAGVPASLGYAMRDLAGSIGAAFQEADHAMYAHKRARKMQAAPAAATGTQAKV